MNMRKSTSILIGAALFSMSAVLPGQVSAREVPKSRFVVTCTSRIAWDIGPSTALAFGRCKGRGARLLGALSSTYLAANNLHQISARYTCKRD